jgi:hypothetical protein
VQNSIQLLRESRIATIVDTLGMEHLSLNDADAEPMADCFQTSKANWTFNAIVPTILKTSTTLPLPMSVKKAISPKHERADARFSKPLHDGSWVGSPNRRLRLQC